MTQEGFLVKSAGDGIVNKTRIIKETIGNVLSKLDFKYAGKDQKIVCIEGVKEQVFIQQHTAFDEEYKKGRLHDRG